LLRRTLPLREEQLHSLLAWVIGDTGYVTWYPLAGVVKAVEDFAANKPLGDGLVTALHQLVDRLRRQANNPESRKCLQRLEVLLGTSPELPLIAGEVWSDAASADLRAMTDQERGTWIGLLKHCRDAPGGAPSARWVKEARSFLAAVGEGPFKEHVLS